MNTDQIRDEVLQRLSLIRDDQEELTKLLNFMCQEISDGSEDDEIPEIYQESISEIAENLDAGSYCYINHDTLEVESVPPMAIEEPEQYLDAISIPGHEIDELTFLHDNWKKFSEFTPISSHDGYRIMEAFAHNHHDHRFSKRIFNALNRSRPFANFKDIVDNSDYRQEWYDFKQQWLEEYVWGELQLELK